MTRIWGSVALEVPARPEPPGDVVVTDDLELAARCLAGGARALDTRGRTFQREGMGAALERRDRRADLRTRGRGAWRRTGPPPRRRRDRARFRQALARLVDRAQASRTSCPTASATATRFRPSSLAR